MNGGRSASNGPAVAINTHADGRNDSAKDLRINGGRSASNEPAVATNTHADGRNDRAKDVHDRVKDVRIKELEALVLASQQESAKQKKKMAEMQRNQNSMMEDISRQRQTSAEEDAKIAASCVKEVAKWKKKNDLAKLRPSVLRQQKLAPGKSKVRTLDVFGTIVLPYSLSYWVKRKNKPDLQQPHCIVGANSVRL
jgi:hypothetical protein